MMDDQLNSEYDDIADEFADEYDEEYAYDEPWDGILQQQELEDFEQCDEYFGYFGNDEF